MIFLCIHLYLYIFFASIIIVNPYKKTTKNNI